MASEYASLIPLAGPIPPPPHHRLLRAQVVCRAELRALDELALRSEVGIRSGINHPNIAKLHEVYESPSHFYLVSELFEGGDLFDRVCAKVATLDTRQRIVEPFFFYALRVSRDKVEKERKRKFVCCVFA